MSADPFLITGPAVISFSGGRTSAFMLWRILQAHGGTLPADVVVCFANTGREMPATLDFVRDCGAAWNVPVVWLEYRHDAETGRTWTEVVNHNSASRGGEPFEALLIKKKMTPNPMLRYCTIELKVRQMRNYCQQVLGWKHWRNIVGLRFDEPARVAKLIARNASNKEPFKAVACLSDGRVSQADVFRFWKGQSFDLRLAGSWEGNCDGCFLKNRAAISRMCADHPERIQWWADIETTRLKGVLNDGNVSRGSGVFREDREDYSTMLRVVRDQGTLPFDLDEATIPCDDAGCGV